jgi:hypothetical protein
VSTTDPDALRFMLWRPVEPLLTHCRAVDSIDYHVRSESTSEGMWSDNPDDYRQAGDRGLWQRVTLNILADPRGLGATRAVPVEIDFRGVVLFHFAQAEFEASILQRQIIEACYPANVDEWYDTEPLMAMPGWAVKEPRSRWGAFCLWVCDESPLVDQLVASWRSPKLDVEDRSRVVARSSVFRHYEIGQDDLGTFHIVAIGVSVKRRSE